MRGMDLLQATQKNKVSRQLKKMPRLMIVPILPLKLKLLRRLSLLLSQMRSQQNQQSLLKPSQQKTCQVLIYLQNCRLLKKPNRSHSNGWLKPQNQQG